MADGSEQRDQHEQESERDRAPDEIACVRAALGGTGPRTRHRGAGYGAQRERESCADRNRIGCLDGDL
jgi:hypothetical protein